MASWAAVSHNTWSTMVKYFKLNQWLYLSRKFISSKFYTYPVKSQTIPQFELRLESFQQRCSIACPQAVIDIAITA
jgi:hypothetical protein